MGCVFSVAVVNWAWERVFPGSVPDHQEPDTMTVSFHKSCWAVGGEPAGAQPGLLSRQGCPWPFTKAASTYRLDSRWPEECSAHFPEGSLKHGEQVQFPRALEGMDTVILTPPQAPWALWPLE